MLTTKHFNEMLKERTITPQWVDRTVSSPERTEDREDGTRHFLRRIPERGNRWLRVIVNMDVEPPKAVTVFFDRRVRKEKG